MSAEGRHFRRNFSSSLIQRSARVERPPSLEDLMSLVVRFSPESLTSDQYDHVVRRLNEENISPADGLDYEACFGSGDKMKVSLVWDSREQFEAVCCTPDADSRRGRHRPR